jgi:uncharacterized protein (TIGR00290 family)
MKDVMVSWSGGKDSAFAIHMLLNDKKYNIKGLFSTISQKEKRLPAHEVQTKFIREQAKSIDLPYYEVILPNRPSNEVYEQLVGNQLKEFKKQGVNTIVYADLLLEDMKLYRDAFMKKYDVEGLYPLWKKDTLQHAKDFVSKGFRAIVTTVDLEKLPAGMIGKVLNQDMIDSFPDYVDPSGEYGEFHTFVFEGPIFSYPINVKTGELFTTYDGRYLHVDLK